LRAHTDLVQLCGLRAACAGGRGEGSGDEGYDGDGEESGDERYESDGEAALVPPPRRMVRVLSTDFWRIEDFVRDAANRGIVDAESVLDAAIDADLLDDEDLFEAFLFVLKSRGCG